MATKVSDGSNKSGNVEAEPRPEGVIFDSRYTDSLLRSVAPQAFRDVSRGAISSREVLLNFVLYGHVYIADPTWLSSDIPDELRPLIDDGLVDVVPHKVYDIGLSEVRQIAKSLDTEWRTSAAPVWVSLDAQGRIDKKDWERAEWERLHEESEAAHDKEVALRHLAGVEPLILSTLTHLSELYPGGEAVPLDDLFIDWGGTEITPYDILNSRESYVDLKNDVTSRGSFARWLSLETSHGIAPDAEQYEVWTHQVIEQQARAFDATLTALALDTFASKTGLPIQADTPIDCRPTLKPAYSREAEQLIRIQFDRLRYPVIETVDDVRRLRACYEPISSRV